MRVFSISYLAEVWAEVRAENEHEARKQFVEALKDFEHEFSPDPEAHGLQAGKFFAGRDGRPMHPARCEVHSSKPAAE